MKKQQQKDALFTSQVERLVKIGYHKVAGNMEEEAFIKYLEPLREMALESDGDFIINPNCKFQPSQECKTAYHFLVRCIFFKPRSGYHKNKGYARSYTRNGSVDFTDVRSDEEIVGPYLIDRINIHELGLPIKRIAKLKKKGRFPLSAIEGLLMVIYNERVLFDMANPGFQFAGSRFGSSDFIPVLWLTDEADGDRRPELTGLKIDEFPNWSTPSCSKRVSM